VYEDRRLSSIAKNSCQDESVGSVEIFAFETPAKAVQMWTDHGNISVFTLQMFFNRVNYILGEIIGGTLNAARGVWEMFVHLCSAKGTGEEEAAGEICKYLEN